MGGILFNHGFEVSGYYTTDKEKLLKSPNGDLKEPGGLALTVECASVAARDLEIRIFNKREDIGKVIWTEF